MFGRVLRVIKPDAERRLEFLSSNVLGLISAGKSDSRGVTTSPQLSNAMAEVIKGPGLILDPIAIYV